MASPQPTEDRAPTGKHAATRLPELAGWVGEIAELTKPDAVIWCDGSQAEWDRLTTLLVENGTFTRLNPGLRPNSFGCASDPGGGPAGDRGAGFLRAGGALGGGTAFARAGRRAVAVQLGQVHLALPGDQGDLVLRVRLRRERAARQEVLRAADRLGDGAGRGLAGRAHAHRQDHAACW